MLVAVPTLQPSALHGPVLPRPGALPVWHTTQAVSDERSSSVKPGWHRRHGPLDPEDTCSCPGPQSAHAVAGLRSWSVVPAGHWSHGPTDPGTVSLPPAGHSTHAVVLLPSTSVHPAGHMRHAPNKPGVVASVPAPQDSQLVAGFESVSLVPALQLNDRQLPVVPEPVTATPGWHWVHGVLDVGSLPTVPGRHA